MTKSLAELRLQLERLGMVVGDTVIVHASMRTIGKVENGAEGLVSQLLSVIGKAETLVAYVDFEPTAFIPYFEPKESPACREFGVLPEVIRLWPGAVRSINPGASVVAIGAKSN